MNDILFNTEALIKAIPFVCLTTYSLLKRNRKNLFKPQKYQVFTRKLGVRYGPPGLVEGIPFFMDREYFKSNGRINRTEEIITTFNSILSVRETDVFINTFPKCGTTWTNQIVLLLLFKGDSSSWKNNPHNWVVINKKDKKSKSLTPITWPARQYFFSENRDVFLKSFEQLSNPRILKSHMPIHLMPDKHANRWNLKILKGRTIYVTRNPKDALVSMFYHAQRAWKFNGSFSQWFKLWLSNEIEFGNWFDHTIAWWYAYRLPANKGKILWIHYEDLKLNNRETIEKIAKFLYIDDVSDELYEAVSNKSSFSSMQSGAKKRAWVHHDGKPRKNTVNFFRKGCISDWKNHFSKEENEKFNKIYNERMKDVTKDGLVYKGM